MRRETVSMLAQRKHKGNNEELDKSSRPADDTSVRGGRLACTLMEIRSRTHFSQTMKKTGALETTSGELPGCCDLHKHEMST